MIELQKINDHICYFKVPYKDIFVGIYILRTEKGTVLFDTAACDEDVDNYIVPALQQLSVEPTHIFISHHHKDHSGGLARAAEVFPNAQIWSRSTALKEQYPNIHCHEDGELLLDVLQIVTIPGHTTDSAALLDTRTNILVSGDCLQLYGIFGSGYWYGNIGMPIEHYAAIEKLRTLPIKTITTAHDYCPGGMTYAGKEQVKLCLDSCVDALQRIRDMAKENSELDNEQLSQLCNDGTYPKVSARIVGILRNLDKENN